MILEKEQIQRYIRHIIMPEISGKGQKSLLESSVLIYGENVTGISAAVYYAAASGIGHIYCHLEDKTGFEALFEGALDLNPYIAAEHFHGSDYSGCSHGHVSRIIIGSMGFIRKCINGFETGSVPFIPTITAAVGSWDGVLCTHTNPESLCSLLGKRGGNPAENNDTIGLKISNSFSGALSVIEIIKLCLNIGKPAVDGLYFDLFGCVYENIRSGALAKYFEKLSESRAECENDEAVAALAEAKVLVVGSGGLGSPVAYALTNAGIGNIGLMDYDKVELSNLNRQIMHSTSRLGMPKVESAKAFLSKISPAASITTYNTAFSKENAVEIISGYDIVADGLDNLPTRYLLNDACYFTMKPFVEAGVLGFLGLATVIIPGTGPCYRCIFPETKDNSSIPSCAETGVLGPVPGVLGFVQAAEIIKLIIGKGSTLQGKILSFDALEPELCTTAFDRSDKCELCGKNPTITTLGNYEFVCNSK